MNENSTKLRQPPHRRPLETGWVSVDPSPCDVSLSAFFSMSLFRGGTRSSPTSSTRTGGCSGSVNQGVERPELEKDRGHRLRKDPLPCRELRRIPPRPR